MRTLLSGTNIDEATTDYPNGRIRDKSGSTEGTLLNEVLLGDLTQSIQKLINLAGLSPNNLADNETNTHELITALFSQTLPEWKSSTENVDFSLTKMVRYDGGIYYHKTTSSGTTAPDSDTTNWLFLIGYNSTDNIVKYPLDYVNEKRGKIVYSARIDTAGTVQKERTNEEYDDEDSVFITGVTYASSTYQFTVNTTDTTLYDKIHIDVQVFAIGSDTGTRAPGIEFRTDGTGFNVTFFDDGADKISANFSIKITYKE